MRNAHHLYRGAPGRMRRHALLFALATALGCDAGPGPRVPDAAPARDAASDTGAAPLDGAAAAADVADVADAASAAECGDEVCGAGESCATCAADCGPCSCDKEGRVACGGNGLDGAPTSLYRCSGGVVALLEDCKADCVRMPKAIPDRCPITTVPDSLVTTLSPKPYVEGNCKATTYPGWPHAAKECTYSSGGKTATVKVANPSPTRVGRWIVDAAYFIPALRALRDSDAARYEEGLGAIALAMLYQSSRIFPLQGGIIEDMTGTGAVIYPFKNGVTDGCSSGCYCRINSLHRTEYCTWRAWLKEETYDQCIARVGASGLTAGWGAQCLANHVAGWTADYNEHFRAKAVVANKDVAAACATATSCSPSNVVAQVKQAYGL